MNRRFTAAEDDFLRRRYGALTPRRCAAALGRPLGSVRGRLDALGIAARIKPRHPEQLRECVKELNGQGFGDTEIARRLAIPRKAARGIRERLGLAFPAEAKRRAKARGGKAAVRAHGNIAGRVRVERRRQFVHALGWPADLPRPAALILEALLAGPLTFGQLVAVVGVGARRRCRPFLNSKLPGGSYLAYLQRRGLVFQLRCAVRRESVYVLTATALRLRESS
jgi:hypothetical protein